MCNLLQIHGYSQIQISMHSNNYKIFSNKYEINFKIYINFFDFLSDSLVILQSFWQDKQGNLIENSKLIYKCIRLGLLKDLL